MQFLKKTIVPLFILFALGCAGPQFNNPGDPASKEYWQRQLLLCLLSGKCFPAATTSPGIGRSTWAGAVKTASDESLFDSVAADSSGAVYAAGYVNGTTSFDFGTGSVTGAGGKSTLLVKYSSSGSILWAQVPAAAGSSQFFDVATDSVNNIYCAGKTYGQANAGSISGAYSSGLNSIFAMYDSNGSAIAATTTYTASNVSNFNDITVNSEGKIFAVGFVNGAGSYDFGNGPINAPWPGVTTRLLLATSLNHTII